MCNICSATFVDKSGLNIHITSVHEGKKQKIKCVICTITCESIYRLKKHISTVHEGKNFLNAVFAILDLALIVT